MKDGRTETATSHNHDGGRISKAVGASIIQATLARLRVLHE